VSVQSHGTVNTKRARKKIPKLFYVFSFLKISSRVTISKAPVGGLEGDNTK
jgi:hypothetical protein